MILALAGGVGGARLANGLAAMLPPESVASAVLFAVTSTRETVLPNILVERA